MAGTVLGDLTFTPLRRADLPMLGRWLDQPFVARWWAHETSPAALVRDFAGATDGTEPGRHDVAALDGRPFGLIQGYRVADYPEYAEELAPVVDVPEGALTVDYLIGEPTLVGRGLGRRMVAAYCALLLAEYTESGCVVVPVHADNVASWRALAGAGFRFVGEAELEPDNPVDDRRHVVYRLDR